MPLLLPPLTQASVLGERRWLPWLLLSLLLLLLLLLLGSTSVGSLPSPRVQLRHARLLLASLPLVVPVLLALL